MARPLAGVRIADFSHVIAGPLATHFLCLLGAEVIKVEPPTGDVLRNYTQRRELRGMAEAFIGANAGKKSVVLDLKTEAGLEAAARLIDTADILVENFRPGVIDRLGLGYDTVRKTNPKLIFCSISGYGQSGPMRDYPAIDQIIQSVSGLMGLSGEQDGGPMRVGFPIVDTYSALLAAFAIQSAYLQRVRDPEGRGQHIDMSMLDASLVMMASVVNPLMIPDTEPRRTGNRGFSLAPTADTFDTLKDPITIGAVQQSQYERLCTALERPDLLSDPRFIDGDSRMANDRALQAELAKTLATRTALEWEVILSRAGVPAGAVRPIREVLELEQLQGRDLIAEIDVPNQAVERTTVLNAGFRFAHDGPQVGGPPPLLGEHTEAILRELGLEMPRDVEAPTSA